MKLYLWGELNYFIYQKKSVLIVAVSGVTPLQSELLESNDKRTHFWRDATPPCRVVIVRSVAISSSFCALCQSPTFIVEQLSGTGRCWGGEATATPRQGTLLHRENENPPGERRELGLSSLR